MKFHHPHVKNGSVSSDRQMYVVKEGVVDCPEQVGLAHGWKPVLATGKGAEKRVEAKA